jgi:single-strand DNA-binding protein
MANLNHVFLAGNLTKDPEVRYAPSGDAVGDLRLAVNRTYKSRDGQQREETCFVGVTVWGRQAETCAEYLSKGSPVLVEGRLKYDEWEKEGQKNSRLTVVANRVQFLGAPRNASFRDGQEEPPPRRRAPEPEPEPAPEPEGSPPSRPDANPGGGGGGQDDDNLPF